MPIFSQLRLIGSFLVDKYYFDVFVLNPDQFLIMTLNYKYFHPNRRESCILYLMEVDKTNLTCKLLDTKEFSCEFLHIVKDVSCPDKFCLFIDEDSFVDTCCLQRFQLEDSKIKVNADLVNMDFSQVNYLVLAPHNKSFQLKGNCNLILSN